MSTTSKGIVLPEVSNRGRPSLKKVPPYWYPYRTNAKARWFDREILEVVSTEFRDRSVEYYRYALQSGVTTINGKTALPGTIIRNGDTIENIVHRHEPPVTSTPVEILYHDKERDFIVINKPGSIPVHAAGRYFKNSLVEILKNDFSFPNVYTVNRLDRLTSGLMIIALSADRARTLTSEFTSGTIRKEYVARVRGEFPEEEITCEEPLLTIDRQMGLNIIHPEGKEAKTVFNRMHYDKITDTSVVHCRPFTGRSHQIRVHLQYLGHPIANDSVYAEPKIWGTDLGRGGIDLVPSENREAPKPPPGFENSTAEGRGREQVQKAQTNEQDSQQAVLPKHDEEEGTNSEKIDESCEQTASDEPSGMASSSSTSSSAILLPAPRRKKVKQNRVANPAWRTKEESSVLSSALAEKQRQQKERGEVESLPRETGHDIGLGSPVPLSNEAVGVITRMRNQKDEDEDWGRWRDVVFRAQGALTPKFVEMAYAQQHKVPKKAERLNGKRVKGRPTKFSKSLEESGGDKGLVNESSIIRALNVELAEATPSTETQTDGNTSVIASSSIQNPDISQERSSETTITTLDGNPTKGNVLVDNSDSLRPLSHDEESSPVVTEIKGHDGSVDNPSKQRNEDDLYCPECYLPLHPDPTPEKLYIFLHALRYTSASLGAFETRLPEWSAKDYIWEGAVKNTCTSP